jgi:hypothetical protein
MRNPPTAADLTTNPPPSLRIYLQILSLTLIALFNLPSCIAQSSNSLAQQTPVIRSTSSLVLLDVLSTDTKSGLPVKTLTANDFEVLDNGHPVPIATFDSGANFNTSPIALWFVVICNEGSEIPGLLKSEQETRLRSTLFAGKEKLFRPALDHLDKIDRVGVAHWCDNGQSAIDLIPSKNRDFAISILAQTLQPSPFSLTHSDERRKGELACQEMVRLILQNAHVNNPPPLPVLVFLHSDWTGMPDNELNELVNQMLETSGIVFGIKDASVPDMRALSSEQGSVFHFMAQETGGHYLSVPPEKYGIALEEILLQLHFRYQLGFVPPALDGKRHKLVVRFTKQAQKNLKHVRLRSRLEYIPQP